MKLYARTYNLQQAPLCSSLCWIKMVENKSLNLFGKYFIISSHSMLCYFNVQSIQVLFRIWKYEIMKEISLKRETKFFTLELQVNTCKQTESTLIFPGESENSNTRMYNVCQCLITPCECFNNKTMAIIAFSECMYV